MLQIKSNSILRKIFLFSTAAVIVIMVCTIVVSLSCILKADRYASAEENSDAIEFVYQYFSELKVGNTQKVAVGFTDAFDAANSKIVYRKVGTDEELVLDRDAVIDNIAYYSTELSDDSYVGTYIFNMILWGNECQYKKTINDDRNFLGQFNCTYASELDDDMPAGVYSIGQDGKLTQINTASDNQSLMIMTEDAVQSIGNIQQNGAVVALDPGHGGNDPGACYGDLQEKNLNWAIAMSCQNELLQYDGVSVYITREENECPDLKNRVERALSAGASIFVSLHNNSGGQSGVQVWAQYKGGWASDCSDRGYDIGGKISNKISANLNLANLGIQEKYCTDGLIYPDGSIGDYYTVLYWSRYYSIPGIIVEHAFVDGDYKILADNDNLAKMGILDAQSIAESYGWKKTSSSGGENIVGTYNIEMKASSSAVVDVRNASTEDEANVEIGKKSSAVKSQQWRIVTDKDGWATILNVNSGKVLDVVGGSSEPRTNVQQCSYSGSDAQKWAFHKNSDGNYYIASKLGNNQVLDVDDGETSAGTNITIFTKSDSIAQSFTLSMLEQPESGIQINGHFYIKYAGGNSQVMDIESGSKEDRANVDIFAKNDTDAQKFAISTDLDGYATITNIGSGKVLDVECGWTYPCSNVQQYSNNGSDAQKYKIIANNDNTVTFVPKCNENVALDVEGAKSESGTNVWTYYLSFATSQKWQLEDIYEDLPASTADIENGNYKISSTLDNQYAVEIENASKSVGGLTDLSVFDFDSLNMVFSVIRNGNYYYIVNVNSGLALDFDGPVSESGKRVHQWTLDYANPNQMWAAYKQSDGSIQLRCRANKGYLAGASIPVVKGAAVVTVSEPKHTAVSSGLDGSSVTSWNVCTPSFDPVELNGEYYISSSLDYGKVVDVDCGSHENGANVQLYDINRTDAQKWKITTDKDKYATIENVGSGKVLDIAGANYKNCANVWQYENNGTDAQKWLICKSGNYYTFRSAGDPRIVLDVAAGMTSNGTNIQVYESNLTAAQKFDLTETKTNVPDSTASIADGKYAIMSNISTTRGLNVSGDVSADNTSIKLNTFKDNVGSCAFYTRRVGKYYQITNAASGMALGINGVNVVTKNSDKNDSSQLWSALNVDDGVQFVNVAYGLYMNVENGLDQEGQNISVYKKNSSNSQSWKLNSLTSPVGEQVNGTFYISMCKNTNQVIDVACGSMDDCGNVQIYEGNYTGAQKWIVSTDANGIAIIKNAQSGKVLDITGGQLSSGSNVWQYSSNGSNAQKFKFVKDGDGYRIYSAVNDYICVDVVGGSTSNLSNVQVYSANGTDAQKFMLFNVSPPKPSGTQVDIENTTFKIATKLHGGYVVDIDCGSSQNGANIQLYSYNGSGAQIFWIEKDSGYYRFVNAANGKCIDVDGGKVLPGANVQLWDKIQSNPNQLFAAFDGGNGSIIFQNVASGLVLDLSCATVALGQNIQGYTSNGSDAQKWVLTKTPYNPGHFIMNSSTTYVDQMIRFFNAAGHSYPGGVYASKGAANIETWCQIAYDEAVWEGVDPAVLMAQAMHETGWLQFGGQVKVEQCNFGGFKSLDGSGWQTFPDVRTGLRAQVQHLKAYASTDPLRNACVDPGFYYVSRGCAPFVEDLSGKWAENPHYGDVLVSFMNSLYSK